MIFIGLGANLPGPFGSPEEVLQAACKSFEDYDLRIIRASRMYASAPVPVSDQPWYKNAVCGIKTSLSPEDLITRLHHIESEFGRIRTYKNAPRILDLDVLAYNDQIVNDGGLKVPHPRLHERAFVLYPLQEIAPDWRHPILDKTVDELIENLPEGQEIKALEISLYSVDKRKYGS